MSKHQITTFASIIFFLLCLPFFFYLPIEISGVRTSNLIMRILFSGFLSFAVSILAAVILVLISRPLYVSSQIATFLRFRHLLFLIVKRDFVTRYRRSVLGVLWSLLNPLLTMLVLTMVFSHIFRFETPYVSFPVYYLSGQIVFSFFSESTTLAMGSIVGNGGVIKKIYVPKYLFPISRILSSMINVLFSFIAFMIVFIIMGESFSWTMFLLPVPFFFVFVFSLGIGMLLSSMSVFFRDINHIYGIGITLLMFLTPVFYPVSILPPRVYHLIHLNPLFHYVNYFRDLALYSTVPSMWANVVCIGFALAVLCLGAHTTMSQQDKYILYL